MALTSIGTQKTPGRPIELTFAADTGLPSDSQVVVLVGHMKETGAASGTATPYATVNIDNAGDLVAASGECVTKFGAGTELLKMVLAAVKANSGGSTFPTIKCIPLKEADTGFGNTDEALTEAARQAYNFIVSCYDGNDATTRGKLKDHVQLVSGAQRVENNQFGAFGVVANLSVTSPSALPKPDTQYLIGIWFRDTAPTRVVGEIAAAATAKLAANGLPFNPLDDEQIVGISAPATATDKITVGAGLESETALGQGWTPLYVKPNGDVAFVRTVTARLTVDADGVTAVSSYYDVQDFQVLYYWRKTLKVRFSQADFKKRKASDETAREIRAELIRLASTMEDNNMFQAVAKLAKDFKVERSVTDRHRFDYKTPVNVIPGLHVLAGNIEAGTQYDTITI